MTRTEFWNIINTLCDRYQGSVTSGYRTPLRNRMVGGVATSKHIHGFAADIMLDSWANTSDCVKDAEYMHLKVIDEVATKNHIHLQPEDHE